jgi:spore cortex formation protein SpoVR/YcgB (stage V sporulation)
LFHIHDDADKNYLEISAIHNESGYKQIRETLSNQYNLSNLEANIQIIQADVSGDRSLTLQYTPHRDIPLADSKHEVLKHLYHLWQFDVKLVQTNNQGTTEIIAQCPKAQASESETKTGAN